MNSSKAGAGAEVVLSEGFHLLLAARGYQVPSPSLLSTNRDVILSGKVYAIRKQGTPEHILDSSPIPSRTSAEIRRPSVSKSLRAAPMRLRPQPLARGSLQTKH